MEKRFINDINKVLKKRPNYFISKIWGEGVRIFFIHNYKMRSTLTCLLVGKFKIPERLSGDSVYSLKCGTVSGICQIKNNRFKKGTRPVRVRQWIHEHFLLPFSYWLLCIKTKKTLWKNNYINTLFNSIINDNIFSNKPFLKGL